jgi:hypothetical protein
VKTRGRQSRANQAALNALLRDVEQMAVVVADTAMQLRRIGLTEYARPLERALARLGG